jgi:hypothetical protein
MRPTTLFAGLLCAAPMLSTTLAAQARQVLRDAPVAIDSTDPVALMVARLDLERYKATIKGLTQFGDRRAGTDRNRAAIDWIEAQLKSYGCTNTERITGRWRRDRDADPTQSGGGRQWRGRAARRATTSGGRRTRTRRAHPHWREQRFAGATRRTAARAQRAAGRTRRAAAGLLHEDRHDAPR